MNIDYLISEIFLRPALWDRKNTNHHNRFVLEKSWDEVAFKMNTTRIVVRNRWKSLRDKFRTAMASIPKSKSGDIQINDYTGGWRYFNSLLFLKDQFFTKKSDGDFLEYGGEDILDELTQTAKIEIDEGNVIEQAAKYNSIQSEKLEYAESVSCVNTPTPSQASSSIRRYPLKRLSEDDISHTLLDMEKQKLRILEGKTKRIEDDEDLNFFKSLLPHVKKLSSYDKMEYRIRVMKVTQDFLEANGNSH